MKPESIQHREISRALQMQSSREAKQRRFLGIALTLTGLGLLALGIVNLSEGGWSKPSVKWRWIVDFLVILFGDYGYIVFYFMLGGFSLIWGLAILVKFYFFSKE
ncbi:MAG: hypothetical protein LBO00_09455 [Zoogloeaceae bacterium]|jgi:hypothetical protein|nr:hypothetical protein [Zoogloeaceae bacterium]